MYRKRVIRVVYDFPLYNVATAVLMDFRDFCVVAERKTRGETEMGIPAFRKASERHNSRVQRGLRAEHNRQKTGHVRAIQPRSEGQNAAHRLSPASR